MATMQNVKVSYPSFNGLDFSPPALPGDLFRSHKINAYILLVGNVERFIQRSVLPYHARLPPELRDDLKKLVAQEANHAREHDRLAAQLKAYGVDLSLFFAIYNWLHFVVLERLLPTKVKLALAAGIEHFNTTSSAYALANPLENIPGRGWGAFLTWHFREEIEHRSVVFDIMLAIGCGGLSFRVVAVVGMLLSWLDLLLVTVMLAVKSCDAIKPAFWRGFWNHVTGPEARGNIWALSCLLQRSFHPSKTCARIDGVGMCR